MPASLNSDELQQGAPAAERWVRWSLALIVAGLVAVFAIAAWLNPYDEEGQPLRMETHRQLGLPPCTFYRISGGMPCPSCGMTTSFALLVRGDVRNSLRANFVGTALALFWLFLIPWATVSIVKGRFWGVHSIEVALSKVVLIFIVLMLGRWGVWMLWTWLTSAAY